MTELTSRERLICALSYEGVDHVPCSFMSNTVLRKRVNEDLFQLALSEKALGLDAFLFIPTASRPQRPEHPDLRGLPVRFAPEVNCREWIEQLKGDFPIIHKEYQTPAGMLVTSVKLSDDWPHGQHIPFMDDYQIPRSLKPLVTQPSDLAALQFLLLPPSEDDKLQFMQEAQIAKQFIADNGLFLVGGWGVGMDMAFWLCGMESLMALTFDRPEFVSEILNMIHTWNVERMKLVCSVPVDLYIRRAWYEGCDFITPRFYRDYILPNLKREVELAHQYGVKFGYICSSGTKPMLDYFLDAGIDVLIGIDPIQGTHTDMALMKQKFDKRICLWGGVSGAVTVERGSEGEVREAVRNAINTLGPEGFILSPVDNITVDEPQTWQNIKVFMDEWKKS